MIEVRVEIFDIGTAWDTLNPSNGDAEIMWLFATYDLRGTSVVGTPAKASSA